MIAIPDAFSTTYREARVKFLEAAAAAGARLSEHVHPLPGIGGEVLAVDTALDGDPRAQQLLMVSSGCHGIEGYCGSGVQAFALHDAEWRDKARNAGVAVLYVHALNPYGFSHGRRVTHENVDLNRNFQDFTQPLPENPQYRALHALLLPDTWPPTLGNTAALGAYVLRHGKRALQAAVSRGQHEFPQGLFFGGRSPTWSQGVVRQMLRSHASGVSHLAWIDVHTGLGPNGHGERIHAGGDAVSLARARAWWGEVTSIEDGSSTSAQLTGLMAGAVPEEAPGVQYTGIALEYGTKPVLAVMQALRAEQWLRLHPQAPAALAAQIHAQFRAAFYDEREVWKAQVITQARQAMFQAVDGLVAQRAAH